MSNVPTPGAVQTGAGDLADATNLVYKESRHIGRWCASAIIIALIVYIAVAFFSTPLIKFGVIPHYLFLGSILEGLRTTFVILAASLALGLTVGMLLAVGRMSANPVARGVGGLYVWFFLATPGIVQLLFWYNLAIVFPHVGIGIPHIVTFWQTNTNAVISPLTASILGLGLHEAAYLCEIIRSGMMSVDRGQVEAAQSLGIRASKIRWHIVLPQGFRVMVPPGMTRVVALMKDTALVVVIAGGELMTRAQEIYSRNYLILELLIVVSIWYLVTVSLLMLVQRYTERWGNRYQGGARSRRRTFREVFQRA